MRALFAFAGIVIAAFSALSLVWFVFFRARFSLIELLKKIFGFALAPFHLLFSLFGWGGTEEPVAVFAAPSASTTIDLPTIQSTDTTIIRHEIAECPPCNVQCPDPPAAVNVKPFELEIHYLKNMVKFLGAIAMRENAINAQYRELYPGFSVMSPHVQRLSTEYQFLKKQLRENEHEWTYFQNYFTKLSGIPSSSTAIHYDVVL